MRGHAIRLQRRDSFQRDRNADRKIAHLDSRLLRPLQCLRSENFAEILAEAVLRDLLGLAEDRDLRFRARDRDVEQPPHFRLVAKAADLFERPVVGETADSGERVDAVADDKAGRILDGEDVDAVACRRLKLIIRKYY